jgi:hypothetical protein
MKQRLIVHAGGFCMTLYGRLALISLPGLLLWSLWFVGPLLLSEGPGSGILLIPFLLATSAIALVASAAVLLLQAPAWHKTIAFTCNVSFPVYFGLAYASSTLLR